MDQKTETPERSAAPAVCGACGSDEPEKALANDYSLVARVVDDSHFKLQIRRCPRCGKDFLFIFTEFIDWESGEDPQYFDLMPLSQEEVQTLVQSGEQVDLDEVMRWSETRRVLQWGKTGLRWATGGIKVMWSDG